MSENSVVINLGKTVTIGHVADVYAQILNSLAQEQTVQIDISQIERIDTSGLQLLYCLSLYNQASNIPVNWSLMSDEFRQSAKFIGINTDIFTANSQ